MNLSRAFDRAKSRVATVRSRRSAKCWLAVLAASAAAFLASEVRADVIDSYNFFGLASPATATATTFSSNLDSTNVLSRGAGAAASGGANSFRTVGFKNDGIATSNTDYFEFSLSATAGNVLSLSSFDTRVSGTATYLPATTQFAYGTSTDGSEPTSFTLIGSATPVTAFTTLSSTTPISYDLSGVTALQNVADNVTVFFRYYASGSTATGGYGFFSPSANLDGLTVNGTVPEPTTVLGGLLLLGVAAWGQRRRFAGL